METQFFFPRTREHLFLLLKQRFQSNYWLWMGISDQVSTQPWNNFIIRMHRCSILLAKSAVKVFTVVSFFKAKISRQLLFLYQRNMRWRRLQLTMIYYMYGVAIVNEYLRFVYRGIQPAYWPSENGDCLNSATNINRDDFYTSCFSHLKQLLCIRYF